MQNTLGRFFVTLKNPRRFSPPATTFVLNVVTIIMYEFETKLLAHENVFLNGLIYIQMDPVHSVLQQEPGNDKKVLQTS